MTTKRRTPQSVATLMHYANSTELFVFSPTKVSPEVTSHYRTLAENERLKQKSHREYLEQNGAKV